MEAPNDQLGHADEAHPLVRRLDGMAAGWLCAGLPDAELPAEAARELERMRADLAEYFALADASWRETCEMAAKQGITSIPIGPAHAAALDKFHDLRALYGPNVGVTGAPR